MSYMYVCLGSVHDWVAPTILSIVILLTPLWVYISYQNVYLRTVLYMGWTPVVGAMIISRY